MNNGKVLISQIPIAEIDALIAEEKLLRLLNPDLQANVELALGNQSATTQYVVQSGGHLYLSLSHISDPKQRHHFYTLVQRYQTGERVNLDGLPAEMRRLLQPELTNLGRFLGSVMLGAFVGLASSIFGMAICILMVNLMQLLFPTVVPEFAGMSITAATFVIVGALGWAAGGLVSWRRLQRWPESTETVLLRRRIIGNSN